MTQDRLRDAFRDQAQNCGALGSPFMERLCTLFAQRLQPSHPLGPRLFDWQGDLSPKAESVPLRLCGALHALRLQGHPTLAAAYPPNAVNDDALWQAVETVLAEDTDFIDQFLNSPPQTNEVRRAAALIAAGHVIADRFGLPLRLSELGASAGLNLQWDRFALSIGGQHFGPHNSPLILTPDWEGSMPPQSQVTVTERRGADINPLNPKADALRLRAYLWPDQPQRLALTDAAIALSTPCVDKSDAIDWLAPRLASAAGQAHMIYSTVAWQYFPEAAKARGTALIEAAGATATADAPLAWFSMENDGQPPGAAMTLRLWPGNETLNLGRIDFHGRWVKWAL